MMGGVHLMRRRSGLEQRKSDALIQVGVEEARGVPSTATPGCAGLCAPHQRTASCRRVQAFRPRITIGLVSALSQPRSAVADSKAWRVGDRLNLLGLWLRPLRSLRRNLQARASSVFGSKKGLPPLICVRCISRCFASAAASERLWLRLLRTAFGSASAATTARRTFDYPVNGFGLWLRLLLTAFGSAFAATTVSTEGSTTR